MSKEPQFDWKTFSKSIIVKPARKNAPAGSPEWRQFWSNHRMILCKMRDGTELITKSMSDIFTDKPAYFHGDKL